jgi:hypothetical protein
VSSGTSNAWYVYLFTGGTDYSAKTSTYRAVCGR